MDCIKARKLLSASIDNELKPDESEEFVFHLQACESCSRELKELSSIHELFESAERYQAPYGFATRVMARVDEQAAPWYRTLFSRRPVFLRFVEVVFAMVVVIMGIVTGNVLMADRPRAGQPAAVQQALSLDVFEATPSGSLGSVYLAVAGVRDER
jgi:anti-sigma factor RsiW